MIPNQRLATDPLEADFYGPRNDNQINNTHIDRDFGGVAFQDPTEGLLYQEWTGRVINNHTQVTIEAPNTPPIVVVTAPEGISEFAFTFDQNMNVAVAYVTRGITYLNWYDTIAGQQVTTEFGWGFNNPRVTLDDKHTASTATSDIILAYLRNGHLYYRQQRDRYTVEYLLMEDFPGTLERIGLNDKNALQFECRIEPTCKNNHNIPVIDVPCGPPGGNPQLNVIHGLNATARYMSGTILGLTGMADSFNNIFDGNF